MASTRRNPMPTTRSWDKRCSPHLICHAHRGVSANCGSRCGRLDRSRTYYTALGSPFSRRFGAAPAMSFRWVLLTGVLRRVSTVERLVPVSAQRSGKTKKVNNKEVMHHQRPHQSSTNQGKFPTSKCNFHCHVTLYQHPQVRQPKHWRRSANSSENLS